MIKFQSWLSKRKKILMPILWYLFVIGLEVLLFVVTGFDIYNNALFPGTVLTITSAIFGYLITKKEEKELIPIDQDNKFRLIYMKKLFQKLCKEYGGKKKEINILIVGDVMLDHKMEGSEAKFDKVQKHQIIKLGRGKVYMVDKEPKTLGGAADIARAFCEVSRVIMIGVIGSDCEGNTLKTICKEYNINFKPIETTKVLTTTKIYLHRLTEGPAEEVIRFDRENIELMTSYCDSKDVQDEIIKKINEDVKDINCIVIKDHQKGMISKELVKKISETASNNNISLYVDPKYDWEKFKDIKVSAILPNMKEAASGLYDIKKEKEENKIMQCDHDCKLKDKEYKTLVRNYPNCDNFIIKAADKGAVILSRNANDVTREEIKPFLNIGDDFETDVGCGDVFDAFAIIGRLHEYTLEESVLFANFAAGLNTKKPLGELISLADIKEELEQESFKKYIVDNILVVDKIKENEK